MNQGQGTELSIHNYSEKPWEEMLRKSISMLFQDTKKKTRVNMGLLGDARALGCWSASVGVGGWVSSLAEGPS